MESYTRFHDRSIQEIIPESQSELLAKILPVAVEIKEGREVEEGDLREFCYLVKIWRDREVLWAQYPAGLLACKTVGDLVEYLYKRHQAMEQTGQGLCSLGAARKPRRMASMVGWQAQMGAIQRSNSLQ